MITKGKISLNETDIKTILNEWAEKQGYKNTDIDVYTVEDRYYGNKTVCATIEFD